MTTEIQEAAERWTQGYSRYCTGNPAPGNPWLMSYDEIQDAHTLANAYIADQAAKAAAAAEVATPIPGPEQLAEMARKAAMLDWMVAQQGRFVVVCNEVEKCVRWRGKNYRAATLLDAIEAAMAAESGGGA